MDFSLVAFSSIRIFRYIFIWTYEFIDINIIVLTTSVGIMDHEEAKKKKTGGKILGFFY